MKNIPSSSRLKGYGLHQFLPKSGSEWAVLASDSLPADSGQQLLFPGVQHMCPATSAFLAPKKVGDKKEVACKFVGGCEKGTVHMQEKSKTNAGFFSTKVPGKSGWML